VSDRVQGSRPKEHLDKNPQLHVRMNKLEIFHRRQLREVLGCKAREISNTALYERCDTTSLDRKITYARWNLFGHILRLARDTPAQQAMDYYSQLKEGETEPRGRPDTTLPVLLFNEYRKYKEKKKGRGWSVRKSKTDILIELRTLAADRPKWRELVVCICDIDKSACVL